MSVKMQVYKKSGKKSQIVENARLITGSYIDLIKDDFLFLKELFVVKNIIQDQNGIEDTANLELKIGFSKKILDLGCKFGVWNTNEKMFTEASNTFEAGIHLIPDKKHKNTRLWGKFKVDQINHNNCELPKYLLLGQNACLEFAEIYFNLYELDKRFSQLPEMNPFTDLSLDLGSKDQPRRENAFTVGEWIDDTNNFQIRTADYLKISLIKDSYDQRMLELQHNKCVGHSIFNLDEYSGYEESKTKKHNKTLIFSTEEPNPIKENYEFMLKWFNLDKKSWQNNCQKFNLENPLVFFTFKNIEAYPSNIFMCY